MNFLARVLLRLFQFFRVEIYKHASNVKINCIINQPLLVTSFGQVNIGNGCTFGVKESPRFYSDYGYIEARGAESVVRVGEKCCFNNSVKIIAFDATINIGDYCLVGNNVEMLSSDFHGLNPLHRRSRKSVVSKDISIGDNVFIGNNVTVLKGVTIGENSIIASNSVVTKSYGKNSVIGGNPARLIRTI